MNEKADKLTPCYVTENSSFAIDDFDTKSCNLNKTDEYFEDKYITSENYGLNSSASQDSITQDFVFNNIVYLGNGPIDEPKNENKILEHIRHFSQKNDGFFIRISIPTNSDGVVVLFDEKTNAIIGTYEISRILFFAHGPIDTPEETCFAFTYSHGENTEDSIFQCLVFESADLSAIDQVSDKFLNAFSVQTDDTHSKISLSSDESFTKILQYNFDVLLDIKEFDYKSACFCSLEPYKNGFCLYPKTNYQFVISIHQIINDNSNFLQIVNSNQKISLYLSNKINKFVFDDFEFTSKEIKIPSVVQDNSHYNIYFLWKCDEWSTILKDIDHKSINKLDLVISLNFEHVQENLEFVLSFPVRLDMQRSHFLDLNTKQFFQKFALVLNHIDDLNRSVISITNLTLNNEPNNNKKNESFDSYSLENNFYTLEDRVSIIKSRSFYELSPSYDEPFLSGTDIDHNYNDNDNIRTNLETKWHDVLSNWDMYRDNSEYLMKLNREGLPSKFRLSFWIKISNIDVDDTIFDTLYNVCASKKTPYEAIIRNDVMRTFSGHEFFKQFGGIGQDEVFRVSCAYSVYDAQLGYCQGMSFIIAALLSHMPEKIAFQITIKLMQDYEIRKLYENSFRYLHLRLYQLNRLIEDQLPSLWLHFKELSIETHMFASQWLLTIFTARFPVYFVNKFLDLFFLLKIEAFFRVSLAILTVFRLELMSLDFEGTLKFFQNIIPRKCTKQVTNLIFSIVDDVVLNSIEIYEKSFLENNYFNDKEKDRYSSLSYNESYEHFVSQIEALKAIIAHCDEERRTLRNSMKVQLENQREIALKESETKSNIIQEYKQCFKTLENQLLELNYKYDELMKQMSSCKSCYEKFLNNEKIDNTLNDKSALKKVHDLELELALTKVLYAEAVCQKDDIAHQFNSLSNDASETRTNNRRQWFNKAMETFMKDFKSKVPNQSIGNNLEKH